MHSFDRTRDLTGTDAIVVRGARLWVDDLRPTPAGFTHTARTYEEAIALLSDPTIEWAMVSFDHDLDPTESPGPSTIPTGYDIACWVETHAAAGQIRPFEWEVHSMNPTGVKNIIAAMTSADRRWTR